MGITPGGVHDENAGVIADGFGEGFGAVFDDDVATADGAWEGSVEGSSVGILGILEFGNFDFCPETWFTL